MPVDRSATLSSSLRVVSGGAVFLCAVLLAAACSGEEESPVQPPPTRENPCRGRDCPVPELTDAQMDQARTILRASQWAQKVRRRGGSCHIDVMGPWFEDEGGTQRLLGVAANITLDPPQSLEGDWPKVRKGPDGQPLATQIHEKVNDVRVLGVLIDLDKNQIAEVEFVDYNVSLTVPPPSVPTPPPSPSTYC